ncbi:hypothetical protein C900_00469 [Fulvivirga imtechensis AK7]|uniref:Transmembrane protein n=1 Tax=Fulvivirga imtechensis AK7 TaxID=1237149 RepID=L8JHS6_9BACT|nr:YfiR family protein [Fulvivirga imtechensis]ELR68370.1 hypothetical protein C900_00469 [Fulvivirga imtechensis AK7]
MVKQIKLLLTVLIIITFGLNNSKAQVSSYEELQAAYLYNFAKYIQWPKEVLSETFVIAVYGKNIPKGISTVLNGKAVRGQHIELKTIDSVENFVDCQILFIPENRIRNLPELYPVLRDRHILLVSENDHIEKGAIISFIMKDNHLQFKLHEKALSEVGLTASAGLLRLAILL